ncbi:MAG TPA: hypothetical protein VEI54_05385 [Candidatus Limnocylindrales bacterium]|nr:hypothetical protein [Candidatus Limnocylindrales bacterium]
MDVKESQAIFLLAKAVYEEPKWGRAMLSPVPVPEDIAPSMKPVMVPDLEIKSIDEGGD